jgi:acyl-CoA synthetase (AMP-forming)/AMP-acid ligase II
MASFINDERGIMNQLYDAFQGIATRFSNATAYQGRDGLRTYAQMSADIEACAVDLKAWPIGLQQRVAISSGPAYSVFVLELACAKHGATVVFLESFMAPNSAEWDDAVLASTAHWAITWSGDETVVQRTAEPLHSATIYDDILLQARTSGTTGQSKGVCLSERAMMCAVRNTQTVSRCEAGCRTLILYEPLGLLSQLAAFATLLTGGTVVDGIHLAAASNELAASLERERISHLVMVPQHIGAVLDDPDLAKRDLSSLQTVIYGAAPVTKSLMDRARRAVACRWLQCYGMTETTGPVTWLDDHEQELAGFSVGQAAPGVLVRICDMDTGDAVTEGQPGEVQVAGDLVMDGYWDARSKRPVSSDRLVDGWLRTGDFGRLDRDGRLALLGRASDDIVCAQGYTLKPAEIEAAIQPVPGVVEVAAIGVSVGDIGLMPVAVCQVGDTAVRITLIADIRSQLQTKLDASRRPTHLVLRAVPLPKGGNGKVHRTALRASVAANELVAL